MEGLKSRDPAERERATADARAHDVDPRMALGLQYLNNTTHKRQTEQRADLERRLRLRLGSTASPEVASHRRRLGREGLRKTREPPPITAEGKAISAQMRRHGNAPPDAGVVSAWFNLILDNSDDEIEEPNARDPRREAALRLAIAEARYHRARHTVDTHWTEPHSAQRRATKLHEEIWTVFDRMPVKISDGPADQYELAYVNFAV